MNHLEFGLKSVETIRMSILTFCQWLQDSAIGSGIRESAYVYGIIESTHVLACAISVGILAACDLRLLGVTLRRQPVSEVFDDLIPYSLVGFSLMFLSGALIFWAEAEKSYHSGYFRLKLMLLLLAGLNALIFHTTTYRSIRDWDLARTLPLKVRLAGLWSLILWTSVIVAGREFAYHL
jgi:uncharacterized protein DUF6644